MAGYDWFNGMSNNAVQAYDNGLKPLSKFTKQDLIDAGYKGTLKKAKQLAKDEKWLPSEWHHSSKYFNRVYFYDLHDLLLIDLKDLELKE